MIYKGYKDEYSYTIPRDKGILEADTKDQKGDLEQIPEVGIDHTRGHPEVMIRYTR